MGTLGLIAPTGDFTEYTNLSVSAVNTNLFGPLDVSLFKWFSVTLTGNLLGTIQAQGSNDMLNWSGVLMDNLGSVSSFSSNIVNPTSQTNTGPCKYRFLRLRCTAFTSGAATGVVELYTYSSAYHSGFFNALLNDGSGNPITGTNPLPTRLSTNNATVPAGVGTTVIKASAGYLTSVTLTGAAPTALTNIFDNPAAGAGTILLTIPATATPGQIFLLNGTALTGITALGIAGSPALTVYFS